MSEQIRALRDRARPPVRAAVPDGDAWLLDVSDSGPPAAPVPPADRDPAGGGAATGDTGTDDAAGRRPGAA